MKFGLFYQLPCAPGQSELVRYQETMEQIIYADELGFDVAWLAELHFYRGFSIMPAPLVVAATLAARTKRIRLGIAVNLLPLHHPLRAAEEGATLDLLSGGRLEFGVGRGAAPLHFQGFQVSREESRERFEETLTVIKQAWTSESVSFTGRYYQIPETAVVPRPVQKPHPPIRIAANSAETAAFAGRQGYPIFVATPVNPMPQFFEQVRTYQHAWRAAGHPDDAGDIAAAFLVYTADTLGQGRRETEASLSYYFQTVGELVHLGERGQGQQSYEYLRGVQERATISYDQVHDTMAVFGNPDECIAKITDIHRQVAIRQLICWFNPGGLVPHRQVMKAMQRFATDVIPATRNL